jgi:hypothetical protein
MAVQTPGVGVSGANSSVQFLVEKYCDKSTGAVWKGTFNTKPNSTAMPFFVGTKISGLERNNNLESIYDLGSREPSWIVAKSFTGTISIEGLLSTPWAFLAVCGGHSKATAGSCTAHTFVPVNGVSSLTIQNYIDLSPEPGSLATANDESRIVLNEFNGCICTSCNVSASVGEIASVKMDFAYAKENVNTTLSSMVAEIPIGAGTSYDFFPFTFAHGYVTYNGLQLAEVQSCDITVNPNAELVWGFGSRMAGSAVGKAIEYDISVTLLYEDPFVLQAYLYGATAYSETDKNNLAPVLCLGQGLEMIITFNNSSCGLTNANTSYREIQFKFGGVLLNSDSLPQSANEMLIENANLKAKSMSIIATNNSSNYPYLPSA